jgi:hypothetical protein
MNLSVSPSPLFGERDGVKRNILLPLAGSKALCFYGMGVLFRNEKGLGYIKR